MAAVAGEPHPPRTVATVRMLVWVCLMRLSVAVDRDISVVVALDEMGAAQLADGALGSRPHA